MAAKVGDELSQRERWVRRIDNLLARAYNIGISTGAHTCALVVFDDSVHHFATDGLDPLISNDKGRKVLANLCLKAKDKLKDKVTVVPASTPVAVEEPRDDPVVAELDTESSEFIMDLAQREAYFKREVSLLIEEAKDISHVRRPSKGCEVLVLVAAPNLKVISWATPKLDPLIRTEQGKALLSAILTSSSEFKPDVSALQARLAQQATAEQAEAAAGSQKEA